VRLEGEYPIQLSYRAVDRSERTARRPARLRGPTRTGIGDHAADGKIRAPPATAGPGARTTLCAGPSSDAPYDWGPL
jgi:hypothetical protein